MANLSGVRLPGLDSLLKRVAALEKAVKFQASSRDRIGRSTIETGRSLLVRGLLQVWGALSVTTDDGVEIIRVGSQEFGPGLTFNRRDGSRAFGFQRPFANSEAEYWSFYDRAGNGIIGENLIGQGLSRPYLEHPFQPIYATTGSPVLGGPYGIERTSTSATWETIYAYDGKVQNPFIDFKFATLCSDITTAAELQIVDLATGLPLNGFLSAPWVGVISAGPAVFQIIDPTPTQVETTIGIGPGSQARYGVQIRRTAGAGSITVSVMQSIGG